MDALLTAAQVAETLGVRVNYVYELATSGRIPSLKIGGVRRFEQAELTRWLESCRT